MPNIPDQISSRQNGLANHTPRHQAWEFAASIEDLAWKFQLALEDVRADPNSHFGWTDTNLIQQAEDIKVIARKIQKNCHLLPVEGKLDD